MHNFNMILLLTTKKMEGKLMSFLHLVKRLNIFEYRKEIKEKSNNDNEL